jgi:cell fate regulator YaaT (PSP1 superfamily)
LERDATNRRWRAEAKLAAKKLIKRNQLPMKVVAVDYIDSGIDFDQLVVIYFTAPHRVDFRTLVSELARTLHARIDLCHIGFRDAAQLVGGLGTCGRDLGCATFLKDLEQVSLRMVKVQDLPPNPLKISGACGRLMCCLNYERPLYTEFVRAAPAVGDRVALVDGDGVVVSHQVPADSVVIRLKANGSTRTCSLAAACGARQLFASRATPAQTQRPPRKGPDTAAPVRRRGELNPQKTSRRAAVVDLERAANLAAAAHALDILRGAPSAPPRRHGSGFAGCAGRVFGRATWPGRTALLSAFTFPSCDAKSPVAEGRSAAPSHSHGEAGRICRTATWQRTGAVPEAAAQVGALR